jgi:putative flippase GtrA
MSNRIKTKESKEKKKINNTSKNIKKEKKAIDDETLSTVRSELKKKNISLNKQQEELMIQIFKFIVVGGIATVIDWIIYFVLYHFIKIEPIIANIISFAVSVVYNYWASCKYVFKVNKEKSRARQFVEFIVFAVIGLLINEVIIWGLHNELEWNAMLVKVIATAIVMVFNFVTRKKFLEK